MFSTAAIVTLALSLWLLVAIPAAVLAVRLPRVSMRRRGEASALIAFAAIVAGRLGEDAIRPPHLAYALAGGEDGRARFAARGLDAKLFADRVYAEIHARAIAMAATTSVAAIGERAATTVDGDAKRVILQSRRRSVSPDSMLDVLLEFADLSALAEGARTPAVVEAICPARDTDVLLKNDDTTPMKVALAGGA